MDTVDGVRLTCRRAAAGSIQGNAMQTQCRIHCLDCEQQAVTVVTTGLLSCHHANLHSPFAPSFLPGQASQLCKALPGGYRIQRDIVDRGRDVAGVIQQYTKFVKPAFDTYVAPSRKHADVIVPWAR